MNRTRVRALVLGVAAVALVAIAVVATASARPQQQTTTLTFWSTMNDQENDTLKNLISAYEKANPNVKINMTVVPFDQREVKFSTAASAGTAPDIMRAEIADVANWAARGFLTNITSLVKPADRKDFLPAAFAYYNWAGKIWGIPQAPDAPALLYNKKMIKAAGLNPAKPPKTMAELTAWCNKVGSNQGIFLRADAYWTQAWVWAYGGGLTDPAKKQILIANSGSRAGMTAYKTLFSSKCAFPDTDFSNDYGNAQTAFKNGQVAMIVNGPWSTADVLQGPQFRSSANLGVAPIPMGPTGQQGSPVGGNGFVLSKNSKNVAAAYKFISFLTNNASQAAFASKNNLLPSRVSSYKIASVKTNRIIGDFLKQMKVAHARPVDPKAGQIYADMGPNVQKILKNQVSVAKGLADTAAAWKQKLWPTYTIVLK
jgi:arabinogalactan oligomer / maltooligosaccharide transport system substrate-binding protein